MSAGASLAERRKLEIDGMLNVRDLGGIPLPHGKRIRSGQLLRTDSPQFMTAQAAERLIADGFTSVLDLRYPTESETEGIGHLDGRVEHVNIPIASSDNQTAPGLRQMLEAAEGRPPAEVVFEYYQGYYLANEGQGITGAIRRMVQPGALPMIVHCAAGKDRTGCVVATALAAVGASDEVIADDYAASAEAVPAIVARLQSLGSYTDIDETTVDMQRTRAETMMMLMQWLRAEHGGAREYLTSRGMTEDELTRLSQLLVEDDE